MNDEMKKKLDKVAELIKDSRHSIFTECKVTSTLPA